MTTLLVPPALLESETVTVEDESFKHLFRARRLAEGDRLRVVDGRGRARHATVASVARRRAELQLGGRAPSNEPARRVEVFVAPPKVGRASWMVEKLTELGVRAIRFWATERGPRSYGARNLERLRRVAAAAVEQCERSRVPEVETLSWAAGLERLPHFAHRWLLVPGAPLPECAADGALALLVGPEGGWTEAERSALLGLPSLAAGLGPTVMRVETAAVVGAARALLG